MHEIVEKNLKQWLGNLEKQQEQLTVQLADVTNTIAALRETFAEESLIIGIEPEAVIIEDEAVEEVIEDESVQEDDTAATG